MVSKPILFYVLFSATCISDTFTFPSVQQNICIYVYVCVYVCAFNVCTFFIYANLHKSPRFDTKEGDGKIERTVTLDERNSQAFDKQSVWMCRVHTGDVLGAGTDAHVFMVVYGDKVR